jgi:hypothetical protein
MKCPSNSQRPNSSSPLNTSPVGLNGLGTLKVEQRAD